MEVMEVCSKKELVAAIRLAVEAPAEIILHRESGKTTLYKFPKRTIKNARTGATRDESGDERKRRLLAVAKRASKLPPGAFK